MISQEQEMRRRMDEMREKAKMQMLFGNCLEAFDSDRLPKVINTVYALPEEMLASGFFDVKILGGFRQCPRCGARIFDIVELPILDDLTFYRDKGDSNRDRLRKVLCPNVSLSLRPPSGYYEVIDQIKQQYDYERIKDEAYSAYRQYDNMCPYCHMSAKTGNVFGVADYYAEDTEVAIVGKTNDYKAAIQAVISRITEDKVEKDGEYEFRIRHSNNRYPLDDKGIAWAKKQAADMVNSYIRQVDVPTTPAAISAAQNIKKDSQSLTEFVLCLIQMENNIYALKEHLPLAYACQILNRFSVSVSAHINATSGRSELESYTEAVKAAEEAKERAEAAVNTLQSSGVPHAHYSPIPHPSKPKDPVLEKAGLFNKKKVLAQNEALTAAYQAELKAYEEECRRCYEENSRRRKAAEEEAIKQWQLAIEAARQKADAAKAELDKAKAALAEAEKRVADEIEKAKNLPTPASEVQALLDRDVAETEDLLKKTFAARNELYACGVIFEKYRDVVALSSFYEYLMSGRCTKLEGPDGAYNLYESEIRANRVIAQLDQVIDSLEQIKQNQYMMYSAMKQIGSELEQLNTTMSKALSAVYRIESNTAQTTENTARIATNSDTIAQNSSVIAHNTAATAFYAKKNAELTNAMGYLVALK